MSEEPWLPDDVRYNILAGVPVSQWDDWINGGAYGTGPHRKTPKVFACRVNKDINHPNGVKFKKNMQGQYLGMDEKSKAGDLAVIFIMGVTEGPGHKNLTIPRTAIDVGKPWQSSLSDWNLNIDLPRKSFHTQNFTSASVPDTTVLGQTIVRLLTAFTVTPLPGASSELISLLENMNVASVSQIIIKGIKTAGLYNTLSNSAPFAYNDVVNAASVSIVSSAAAHHNSGVYARVHMSNDQVTGWKKDTGYIYVGHTQDFAARFKNHPHSTSLYGQLTRNSKELRMFALCVLPPSQERAFHLLVEQLFVCLLQTYRASVLVNSSNLDPDYLQYVLAARYFRDISMAVFGLTGWQGGAGRPSFGITEGANCSSPLLELGAKHDKFLFIRTDADVKDGETGKVIPMAFYHRANHCTPFLKSGTGIVVVQTLSTWRKGKRKCVFKVGYRINTDTTAEDWPLSGTPYDMVIEVCKDGSKHPKAWAMLADIGGFENWTQANSFAIRIEWQLPSGQWTYRYIHARRLFTGLDTKDPGSHVMYIKGITFLQWLTNSAPNHNYSWIPRVSGCARVLHANYDFMNQTIKFSEPTSRIRMHSGRALSLDEIKVEMNQPRYGLMNVDGPFGAVPGLPGGRVKCDCCVLLGTRLKTGGFACVRYKKTNYCTTCKYFNRSCCSYTPNIYYDSRLEASPESRVQTNIVMGALVAHHVPAYTKPSFYQELREIQSSEQQMDDADHDGDDERIDDEDID